MIIKYWKTRINSKHQVVIHKIENEHHEISKQKMN